MSYFNRVVHTLQSCVRKTAFLLALERYYEYYKQAEIWDVNIFSAEAMRKLCGCGFGDTTTSPPLKGVSAHYGSTLFFVLSRGEYNINITDRCIEKFIIAHNRLVNTQATVETHNIDNRKNNSLKHPRVINFLPCVFKSLRVDLTGGLKFLSLPVDLIGSKKSS